MRQDSFHQIDRLNYLANVVTAAQATNPALHCKSSLGHHMHTIEFQGDLFSFQLSTMLASNIRPGQAVRMIRV